MGKKDKKKQIEFLEYLESYFRYVPEKDIDQSIGTLEPDEGKTCGCFGAHVAQATRAPGVYGEYNYSSGEYELRDKLDESTMSILFKHAHPNAEELYIDEQIDLFDEYEWAEHPHIVIKKTIKELRSQK